MKIFQLLSVSLLLATLATLAFSAEAEAQTSCLPSTNDRTIVAPNTVINSYYPGPLGGLTVVPAGMTMMPVDDTAAIGTPIAAGDLVMIIQMQGAEIDTGGEGTVGGDYGDGPGLSDRRGTLDNLEFLAGSYELNIAAGPVMGGVLPLRDATVNRYVSHDAIVDNGDGTGQGFRRYQVVRIPQLRDLTVTVTGSITAPAWNGRTGGIVALDVARTLTLNGVIDVSGRGFRGGSPVIPAGLPGTETNMTQVSIKGEGISGSPARLYSAIAGFQMGPLALFGTIQGQGAPGNAGGTPPTGQIDSGGGGGGGGGLGGRGAVGPGGAGAGSNAERSRGGFGYQDVDRILLGGGGGSGSLDDPAVLGAVSGQAGGGIIYVRAITIAGSGTIRTNGDDGGMQPQEGTGGGCGGGTVFIHTESLDISTVSIEATGGNGGSSMEPDDGGGGGGGGGFVVLAHPSSPVTATIDVSGGAGGTASGGSGEGGVGGFQQIAGPPLTGACPPAPTIDIVVPTGTVTTSTTTPSGTTTNVLDGTVVTVVVTGPGGYMDSCMATVMSNMWSCPAGSIDSLLPGTGYMATATVDALGVVAMDTNVFDVSECAASMAGDACMVGATAGTCRGMPGALACCTGCWDGAVCRGGTALARCGAAGAMCNNCNDSNACTADSCMARACVNTMQPVGTACGGGNVCNAMTMCVACVDDAPIGMTDSGCSAATPACDTSGGAPVCVECLGDGDCSGGLVCDPGSSTCVTCQDTAPGSGIDMGCNMAMPICDDSVATPICRECVMDVHCASGERCNASFECEFFCDDDGDCAGMPGMGVCDVGSGTCVACTDDMSGGATDSGCTAAAPLCDDSGGAPVCVRCFDDVAGGMDVGCDVDNPVCDATGTPVCVECEDDSAGMDFGCEAVAPVCNEVAVGGPACQECVVDGDCPGVGEGCSPSGMCVFTCTMDSDCTDPTTPVCDTGAGVCVECTGDGDCAGRQTCSVVRTCELPDSDGDGIPDDVDLDDDNDGVLDIDELDGMDLSLDSDMDGIQDFEDPDAVTCTDGDSDGICDALPASVDFDGDGIANHLDLDADGDGISDLIEGGGADTDGDALVDGFADLNGNGVDDGIEALPLPLPNTDGTDGPDFLDLDADDDGLTDALEGGVGDVDGDGRPDGMPADANGDGIADVLTGGGAAPIPDTDGDGTPDYQSVDSDGDGVPDVVEGHDDDGDGVGGMPSGSDTDGDGLDDAFDPDCAVAADCGGVIGVIATQPDTDTDGLVDWRDIDDDADGIPTELECPNPAMCADADMDGTPDYLEQDSDDDGLPDVLEGHDTNFDGVAEVVPSGSDTDGDGLDDAFDPDCAAPADCGGVIGVPAPLPDVDDDDLPNYQDADDDGDGRSTRDEVQDAAEYIGPAADPTDVDGDVRRNWYDTNSDGDAADDATEQVGDLDLDDNGILDYLDPDFAPEDTDGDGFIDPLECPGVIPPTPDECPDSDGDGTPDYLDVDDDNDGVLTRVERDLPDFDDGDPGNDRDADGDGIPNHLDLDTDDDGIPDLIENGGAAFDADGNGRVDDDTDADGDGLAAVFDPDDSDPLSFERPDPLDTDGMGGPDLVDLDADGDGILDIVEADGDDANDDGQVDDLADADGDGLSDVVDPDTGGTPWPRTDTDDDGTPDFQDLDSDGDTIVDAIEGHDVNADGVADVLPAGMDANGNGIDDAYDPTFAGGTLAPLPDRDADGTPDWRDIDDDGDSLNTIDEIGDGARPRDTDMDGNPDYLDDDDDGDTIPTLVEIMDGDALSGGPNSDVDGDGIPNWLDTDSDGDGVSDMEEGRGDDDGDGDPNYLDIPGDMPTAVGIAGGAFCSTGPMGSAPVWMMLLVVGLALRRRR